jgi:malate dehydrogenase (oxaloacetate-decarboxylating)(NADP+)
MVMRPLFAVAKSRPARVAYAEGETTASCAIQVVLDEGLAADSDRPAGHHAGAHPARGLRLQPGRDFEVVNPEDDPRHRAYSDDYHGLMGRQGITPEMAKAMVRRSNTLIAALMIRRGDADAMVAGLVGRYEGHLEHVRDVIGLAPGAKTFAAMNVLMLGDRTLFLTDTFVNEEPSASSWPRSRVWPPTRCAASVGPPIAFLCTPTSVVSSAARRSACARLPSASAR